MDMPQELVNLTDDEKDKLVGDESDSDIENDDGEDTDEDSGEDEEIAHILSTSDIPHVLNASTLNIEVDDEIDSPNMDHEIDVEESYQKIDKSSVDDLIKNHYPELILHNFEEISAMSKVLRNKFGDIIDDLHHTLPYITRFEKAKILGVRSRQINTDPSVALVEFDSSIIDGYKIALEEYKQQKIPFIIKRPLPDGTCEYWKFSDLEQL